VLGTRHPVALTQLRRRPLSSCLASFWFVVDCTFLWKVMTTSRRLVSPAGRRFYFAATHQTEEPRRAEPGSLADRMGEGSRGAGTRHPVALSQLRRH
jgi:hypothetical protein